MEENRERVEKEETKEEVKDEEKEEKEGKGKEAKMEEKEAGIIILRDSDIREFVGIATRWGTSRQSAELLK